MVRSFNVVCWWSWIKKLSNFPPGSSEMLEPPSFAGEESLAFVEEKAEEKDGEEDEAS